jgi:glucosamine--fructose-6-phosphate aminotransferase (isomerizing)
VRRASGEVIFTQAGPEIGVAATKTFTTQLIALYLLAMRLAIDSHRIGYDELNKLQGSLRGITRSVQNVLDNAGHIESIAKKICKASDVFFIGRNINYPVALEGALKLKEISYIHAEGYPAGELKHGPIALLTKDTPVIAIAVPDHTYDKVLSNISEVSARNAPVIGIGYESDRELGQYVDDLIQVPDVPPLFSPIPITVALQLLAYYTARERKCEIDKPRNLAKSVTVE